MFKCLIHNFLENLSCHLLLKLGMNLKNNDRIKLNIIPCEVTGSLVKMLKMQRFPLICMFNFSNLSSKMFCISAEQRDTSGKNQDLKSWCSQSWYFIKLGPCLNKLQLLSALIGWRMSFFAFLSWQLISCYVHKSLSVGYLWLSCSLIGSWHKRKHIDWDSLFKKQCWN